MRSKKSSGVEHITGKLVQEVIISSSLIEGQENAEMTAEEATEYYKEFFKSGETFNFNYQLFSDNEFIERDDFKVVGVIPINDKNAYLQGTVIMSDAWFNKFVDNNGKGIYTPCKLLLQRGGEYPFSNSKCCYI